MKRCIASIAFRDPYVGYQTYFMKSLQAIGNTIPVVSWTDEYPPNSPTHQATNYAFKFFALQECRRRGFESVLWLDCSCYFHGPLEPFFDEIEREGHYFLVCADRLGNWTSDNALEYFGMTRDEAMEKLLLCGTIYGFDFTNPRTQAFFDHWGKTLVDGVWGQLYGGSYKDEGSYVSRISKDPRCQGHRSDEVCATVVAERLGMKTVTMGLFGGGIKRGEGVIVNSGYDLGQRKTL